MPFILLRDLNINLESNVRIDYLYFYVYMKGIHSTYERCMSSSLDTQYTQPFTRLLFSYLSRIISQTISRRIGIQSQRKRVNEE